MTETKRVFLLFLVLFLMLIFIPGYSKVSAACEGYCDGEDGRPNPNPGCGPGKSCPDYDPLTPGCQSGTCCTNACCCDGGSSRPDPPECDNFKITATDGNPRFTTSTSVLLDWDNNGDDADEYRFKNDNLAWSSWSSYSDPPKGHTLQNLHGERTVTMELKNDGGKDECSAKIPFSRPPRIISFGPTSSVTMNSWSGTADPDDNGTLNGGEDNNPVTFEIVVEDPDGWQDLRLVNFGMNESGSFGSDTLDTVSCGSDDLEKTFYKEGVAETFTIQDSGAVSSSPICGVARGGRYHINNVSGTALNGTQFKISFQITFDPLGNNSTLHQGKYDIWLKAADEYWVWSGPQGKDLYTKMPGWWGVDTRYATKGHFEQKQPYNAETLRVLWDAHDATSGVVQIEKGCIVNGDEYMGSECESDPVKLLPLRANDSWGEESFAASPKPSFSNPAPLGTQSYQENRYQNVQQGNTYSFMVYATDQANNRADITTDSFKVGQKWMQIISGDVFGNDINIPTPLETLDTNGNIRTIDQILEGRSSIMLGGPTDAKLGSGKNVTPLQAIDYGSFSNGVSNNQEMFVADGIYDTLNEDLPLNHQFMIVCFAGGDPPCTDPNAANGINAKVEANTPFITEDGVYHVSVGDGSINGFEVNKWATSNVKNVILLLESASGGNSNLRVIGPIDPSFNLIIISRSVNIDFVSGSNPNSFELDFIKLQNGRYCRHDDPINDYPRTCITGRNAGWYSLKPWESTLQDGYTYFKMESTNDNDYEDLEDNVVIDPGVYKYGLYLISNSQVTFQSQQTTWPDDWNGPDWDLDLERYEIYGGIVAQDITFGNDLLARDNTWIPAEKFIYGPQFIDAYIKATKDSLDDYYRVDEWQEVGLEF